MLPSGDMYDLEAATKTFMSADGYLIGKPSSPSMTSVSQAWKFRKHAITRLKQDPVHFGGPLVFMAYKICGSAEELGSV